MHSRISGGSDPIDFRPDAETYLTQDALDFLSSLGIQTSPKSILIIAMRPGTTTPPHTDYVIGPMEPDNYYRGWWSLNIPINPENVFTEWYDGTPIVDHKYTMEEAGNLLYSTNITRPCIMRTDLPHRVNNQSANVAWRLSFRGTSLIQSWDDAIGLFSAHIEQD